jgi:hypothetical protein
MSQRPPHECYIKVRETVVLFTDDELRMPVELIEELGSIGRIPILLFEKRQYPKPKEP